jgi:hypothetical protein
MLKLETEQGVRKTRTGISWKSLPGTSARYFSFIKQELPLLISINNNSIDFSITFLTINVINQSPYYSMEEFFLKKRGKDHGFFINRRTDNGAGNGS